MNSAISKEPLLVSAAPAGESRRPARSAHKRAMWDLAIWVAGLVYLGVVLFENLSMPLFGAVWVVLAVHAIRERHRDRRVR